MSETKVDVLIAGGGVAGLVLAHVLRAGGRRVIVASDPGRAPASQAAVGLLNPVIGQRFTVAWKAAEALPEARNWYRALEQRSQASLFRDLPIARVLRSTEEREMWHARATAIVSAGFAVREMPSLPAGFRRPAWGAVEICGAGLVDPCSVVELLRRELAAADALIDARCPADQLRISSHQVVWPDRQIVADALVLAGGFADVAPDGAITHLVGIGLGHALPIRPVKGESLLVQAPDLAPAAVYACGHFLAPRQNGLWVCGATQVPECDDRRPSLAGRQELERFLADQLACAWTVVGQRAGVRPTSPDVRPILGRYASDAPVYVINGLGSRGIALAPWAAGVLAASLEGIDPPAEVRPSRFAPPPVPPARWHAVDIARDAALRRVRPGDFVLDLTTGNGGDTLWLAQAVGANGHVLGFDIQPTAIESTRRRLAAANVTASVELVCADHARLAEFLPPGATGRVAVAVANLGHLPGSSSPVITRPGTTVAALAAACPALRPGGALVVVVYVGHQGGPEESAAVEAWAKALPPARWKIDWIRNPAQARRSPAILIVERLPVTDDSRPD